MKISINKAMVDYLTCTTKSPKIAGEWFAHVSFVWGNVYDKIKRYEGIRGMNDGSGVFVGESVGNAKKHYILQISGAMADRMGEFVTADTVKSGDVKITRIDVQVTIGEPREWSQIGYMETCEAAGLKPTIARSRNPIERKLELITIYTGTRTSGRYNRCYQKVMESGERLLRYETEFSRGYAKAVAYGLLSGDITREMVVRGELKRRKIDELQVFDLWQCGLFGPKQEERTIVDNRADWLINDILPIVVEYMNRHDADQRVVKAYVNALIRQEEWGND